MEILRELVPFFLGMVVIPPIFRFGVPQNWSERLKFGAIFAISIIVGLIGSTIVGEQFGDIEERVKALIVDSCTAYAGSQITYWLFWKAILEPRTPNSV